MTARSIHTQSAIHPPHPASLTLRHLLLKEKAGIGGFPSRGSWQRQLTDEVFFYANYFFRSPNRTASDPFGHVRAQRPQRMHSTELNCVTGSMPIGQTVSHLPQCTQVGSS